MGRSCCAGGHPGRPLGHWTTGEPSHSQLAGTGRRAGHCQPGCSPEPGTRLGRKSVPFLALTHSPSGVGPLPSQGVGVRYHASLAFLWVQPEGGCCRSFPLRSCSSGVNEALRACVCAGLVRNGEKALSWGQGACREAPSKRGTGMNSCRVIAEGTG